MDLTRARQAEQAAELEAVHQNGLPSYVRGNLGHGTGLHRAPEQPIVSREETLSLDAGQILSLEFPYYIQGTGAFQIEEAGAVELFNHLPRSMVEIEA
jgi:Xaa-Pro aminopeptidase